MKEVPFAATLAMLFQEIERGLVKQGQMAIAQQINDLSLVRGTYDPSVEAIYLYLSEARSLNVVEQNIIGTRHVTSIDVDAAVGMVVIDVDNFDRVMGVEILNRPDVRRQLEGAGFTLETPG